MDAALIAALEARFPVVANLVTLSLPGHTIRWSDGGFVRWGGEVWRVRDQTFGVLDSLSEIEDGIDGQSGTQTLTILAPSLSAVADLALSPQMQGSLVTVHMAVIDRATGLLIGEPELLWRGELDQPRLSVGDLTLIYDCITEEARMLEPNEERRQNDSFHQSVWPGELGFGKVTDLPLKVYWRANEPTGAIS